MKMDSDKKFDLYVCAGAGVVLCVMFVCVMLIEIFGGPPC